MDTDFGLADRRRAPRSCRVEGHGISQLRLRPGWPARLLDASSFGLCFDTQHRVPPGRIVELHVATGRGPQIVRARVVRSFVFALRRTDVVYRVAVEFDGWENGRRAAVPVG